MKPVGFDNTMLSILLNPSEGHHVMGAITESDLRPGDIVRLNSGGPNMTVTSVDNDDVAVVWFEAWGAVTDKVFPVPCLRRVENVDA